MCSPNVEIKLTSRAKYVPDREITVCPHSFRGQRVTRECGVLNTHEFEMTRDDTTRTVACFGTTVTAASLCCHSVVTEFCNAEKVRVEVCVCV